MMDREADAFSEYISETSPEKHIINATECSDERLLQALSTNSASLVGISLR